MEERARELLGVAPGAAEDELKRAYRNAAKRLHPDRLGADSTSAPQGDEKPFKVIFAAFKLLAEGEESPLLLPAGKEDKKGKYHLDNDWGYFLWWSNQFF